MFYSFNHGFLQVLKWLKKSEGYTDHIEGKVWSRSERPSSYRLEETRLVPRYKEEFLIADNLQPIKGHPQVLKKTPRDPESR